MKIKLEIDATPEEVQDLFIPSNKQKEFVEALYKAYIDAMSKTVTNVVNKVVVENPLFKGRKVKGFKVRTPKKPSQDDS